MPKISGFLFAKTSRISIRQVSKYKTSAFQGGIKLKNAPEKR
jgi:hypothetical protein